MQIQLNKEQQIAVGHCDGACIITATPGSGKTRVITARVINLIKNKSILPRNILCLTFTNKAANEMKNRVAEALGDDITNVVWISTFHKLCLAILRKYNDLVGLGSDFSIYNSKDQQELLAKISRMHGRENYTSSTFFQMAKAVNGFREEVEEFEICLKSLVPEQVAIIKEYLELLDEFNAIDFSGILYKAWQLLIKNKKVAEKLGKRFQYVLIDEGQDTNTIQYEIIKKIAAHGNLFIVGDIQQSIYRFRGARPENLDFIKKDFGDVAEITLSKNYRSTKQILQKAQRLIRHNLNAQTVYLESVRGDGEEVILRDFYNSEDEAAGIASSIILLKEKYNYEWNDFAVLYRTNQQSKSPEIAMRHANIPYRIYGGYSFFDRKEIKTSLAYLSFLANPMDTIAFARAISTPRRQVGSTMIGRIERFSQIKKISILDACNRIDEIEGLSQIARKNVQMFTDIFRKYRNRKMPLIELVSGIFKDTGYYEHMKKESKKDETYKNRIENINELMISIGEFGETNPQATVSDYLRTVQLMTSEDTDTKENAITLLTIHSAKGLEFKVVFVIGVNKDIIPHKLSLYEGNEEEERRLLYVAITRCSTHLYISYCQLRRQFDFHKRKHVLKKQPCSSFLYEIFDETFIPAIC